MYYHTKKEIVYGPHFIEHVYDPEPEIWQGTWRRIGHDVNNSPTSREYLCSSCHEDQKIRSHLG